MQKSQLTVKAEEKQISALQLSSPGLVPNGELALVSLDLMKELLNAHATKVSLRELKEQIIEKITNCDKIEEYKQILAYDLSMLELHANLKAYDLAQYEAKKKEKEGKKGEWETNSIDDMVNRDQ